ncbi:hypothetical protein CANMA_005069 [Candida margitis]|uniref:uncharacterized protein n=1 Tax=Candida margitis TaxID=1775924 RepID=UPI002225BCAC|nr:uncharacterized protein CANMA_005069 [Candida margitis]KAI5952193.1 hypothetical protein CANMA_005069 [Candida margitis]
MQPFANSYWTPDYITGLHNLQSHTFTSLKQLHDFRKLVFNFLKYFHSNSEYLSKTSNELASSGSFNSKNGETLKYRSCIELFKNEMIGESTTLLQLASSIDKFVLEDLTNYLKHHEPNIKKEFSRLEDIYDDYLTSSRKIDKSKSKYFDELRLKENAQPQTVQQQQQQVEDDDFDYSDDESYAEEDSSSSIRQDLDIDFQFPLLVGPAIFETINEFQITLAQLIAETPTVKRKIPIPGYKNDMFVSESLCDALNGLRIHGLKPTRSNFEKFGQSLVTLKLLNPTNIFQKRFKSEGVWFEWSDLAISVSQSHDESVPSTPVKHPYNTDRKVSSPSSKFMSDMSETTTRFNSMFNNVKSSIMKKNHEEIVSGITDQYNEQSLELQELAYLLQQGYLDLAQYLEKFETTKVQIIYTSSAKLQQIIQKFHLQQFNQIQACGRAITDLNKQENYDQDMSLHVNNSSTGIVFPLTGESAFAPQSLKYQFDLFEDISAQVTRGQVKEDCPLSVLSTPAFVHGTQKVIESHEKDGNLKLLWLQPLDFQLAWKIKQDVTRVISQCTLPTLEADKDQKAYLINEVLNHLKERKADDVVTFFKCWLLELKDSVIPFTAFDSVVNVYNGENTRASLTKVLSSLPRCNLACLVSMTEHICHVFELGIFENYGISDDFSVESVDAETELPSVSKRLNDMEAVGSVPFVHLIMRPSRSKYKSGFKPPVTSYIQFLTDLLKLETRVALFNKLIEHEAKYKQKKESELRAGLHIKKIPVIETPANEHKTKSNSNNAPETPTKQKSFATTTELRAPHPVSADEAFTLRPFKTKSTPLPSPRSSPKHTSNASGDGNRSRSSSMLGSSINVQFE